MGQNKVSKEQDKHSGGKIKTPGPDNPAYSKKSSGDSGGDKEAFEDSKYIWNNQTIDQQAPKITEDEADYGKPPDVASDDAKKLEDVRDKFAKNADKPTTASDNDKTKLPEIMQNVDPQKMMQMLPQMFQKMSKVRDTMNATTPAARKRIVTDAFTGALTLLVRKYGYDRVILTFNNMLLNGGYSKIDPDYQLIVKTALTNMVREALEKGPDALTWYSLTADLQAPIYNTAIPSPVVNESDIPPLYTKQYYGIDENPYPGFVEWVSPDDPTKKLYVKRKQTDYVYTSATEETYAESELWLYNKLSYYVELKTITPSQLNDLLRQADALTEENGMNNSMGNGAGGNGGGGQNNMQQLMGQLSGIVNKFKEGPLSQGVLDKQKNEEALKKYNKNMGTMGKMKKDAEGAFGLGNDNMLSQLQGQLSGLMNKGGGGGGGGNQNQGQNQNSGGNGSTANTTPNLSQTQLSNTSKLLDNLQ